MKKTIKLITLFSLLSTGLFAAHSKEKPVQTATIIGKPNFDIEVVVNKDAAAKTKVKITDTHHYNIYMGNIASHTGSMKTYQIADLPEGDYQITVSTGSESIQKQIRVYEADGKKDYFIMQ